MRHFFIIILLLFPFSLFASSLHLDKLKTENGYSIKIYAYPVPNARSMTLGDKGTLFVGTREEGKVYAIIPDKNAPHRTHVSVIASGLNSPNGVAFHKGSLYVAEIHRILRFDHIEDNLAHPTKPIVVTDSLPTNTHHGWRYLKFGPDDKLYIAIGAPCDSCLSNDLRFASIMRMNPDGSNAEVFARGVRNSLGFDWDANKQFWFTDNGRDWLGDNSPPDEVNFLSKPNQHFGFPYCFGKHVADPIYGKDFPCSAFIPPVFELPAHVAALGMRFYHGDILVTEHGSWNRSKKDGYKVTKLTLERNKIIKSTPFITGWLQEEKAWGRPVDILTLPDDSILISDDHAGVIYQVIKKP